MSHPFAVDPRAGFAQILENSAERLPDKTAVVFGDRRISYKQLDQNACAVARLLEGMGLAAGDRVALLMPNCPEFLEVVFGCAKLGVTAVKVNWRLAPDEIVNMFRHNEVKAAFLEIANSGWLDQVLAETGKDTRCIVMDDTGPQGYQKLREAHRGEFPTRSIPHDTVLMHIHTSGTTGTPKCVMYTHGSLMAVIAHSIEPLDFGEDLVFQVMAQLFHSVSIGPYMCLAVGGTLVLFRSFNPEVYLASIQKERVTRISAIPTVLQALLNHPRFGEFDLSSLTGLNYSTCPMSPALIDRALAALSCHFYQSYGMTEMGSIVAVLGREDHRDSHSRRIYSVGRPLPGYQAKVVAPDGTGCPPGVTGEIAIRGPGMMKGYFNMPEATAACIRDGWYFSNDIGYMDGEGYLFLRGRKNDMIITGGENVFPKEIEDLIYHMSEEIAEVAVFSVPDDYWGERIQAGVVLRPGSEINEVQIADYLSRRIAKYKIPKEIHLLPGLPKNPSGKVLRQVLSKQFSGPRRSSVGESREEERSSL